MHSDLGDESGFMRLARDLNLDPTLGSMVNVDEALHILRSMESTRFYTLPTIFRNRGEYDGIILGRTGASVDYLSYNIYMDRALSGTEAYRIIHRNCSDIPDGHPRGWDHGQVLSG